MHVCVHGLVCWFFFVCLLTDLWSCSLWPVHFSQILILWDVISMQICGFFLLFASFFLLGLFSFLFWLVYLPVLLPLISSRMTHIFRLNFACNQVNLNIFQFVIEKLTMRKLTKWLVCKKPITFAYSSICRAKSNTINSKIRRLETSMVISLACWIDIEFNGKVSSKINLQHHVNGRRRRTFMKQNRKCVSMPNAHKRNAWT